MTGYPPVSRLASWLLHRFAFGPQRESLIGDIVEQYQQGRSSAWFHRQVLATVAVGCMAFARVHGRRTLGRAIMTVGVPWCLGTVAWWFVQAGLTQGWHIAFLMSYFWGGVAGLVLHCSIGVTGLLLTITRLDEPEWLTVVQSPGGLCSKPVTSSNGSSALPS